MIIKNINVKGAVQGVGYRPFIAELAAKYNLKGYVKNIGASVEILASGDAKDLDAFICDIKTSSPEGSFIVDIIVEDKCEDSNTQLSDFMISDSSEMDLTTQIPVFLPDIGICDKCMEEMLDPNDRRYRYPLISCASCGPRISILDNLPYDRGNTTMKSFLMCNTCGREYLSGRRRYAQTISCHDCGPQILFKYRNPDGIQNELVAEEAVRKACDIILNGGIIGLKGISGYQLVCKPESKTAKRLREIKGRENKPFAIMFATSGDVREYAYVTSFEEKLLKSSERPIVLLKKKHDFPYEVTAASRYIGAFLPSSGIHRLLCDEAGPLIVTSANISDETIITDDERFYDAFFDKTDGMCYHIRHINIPQDDSVVFVIGDGDEQSCQFMRRARGYAPLPMFISREIKGAEKGSTVFSAGGDLKNTFSFGKGDRILTSSHIGDLKDKNTHETFELMIEEYQRIFALEPAIIINDLHPGYFSSAFAKKLSEKKNIRNLTLQHHFAHVYSVMAENSFTSAIGVAFDGTGYGTDGTIWGGEFLYCNGTKICREGHLSAVRLIGGDAASKNAEDVARCYRLAASPKTYEKTDSYNDPRLDIIAKALINNINTFECSSMGRLFDAVSALLQTGTYNSYEGECAISLENEAMKFMDDFGTESDYPSFCFNIQTVGASIIVDQIDLFRQIERCKESGRYSAGAVSLGFHMAVADLVPKVCKIIRDKKSENKVCLSGGTFNNRIILTKATELLKKEGFEVFWNRKVPLGDGGISVGQAYYGMLGFLNDKE